MTPPITPLPPLSHAADPVRAALEATALRDAIERHRKDLVTRLAAGEDGLALGRANARFLDGCIAGRYAAATSQTSSTIGLALAAYGSFGRGAVALHSDADLMVIVGPADADEVGAFVQALLYPLWDAKLPLGHQILSAPDAIALAQKDLATATALLDLRLIAGDGALVGELVARTNEGIGEEELGAFIDRLESEATTRHERFGGSVYLLEPDVKSGAGGLRDLDGARWAARARYRVGDGDGQSSFGVWGELVRVGVLVSREAQEIAASEEFLWRVRNRLHARSGRKADRLGFEDQEALGAAMGYGAHRAQAAERLMQDYYLHARSVTRARASLLERLRPVRRREKAALPIDLGGGVHLFDGHVTIASSADLLQDPALAMRVFAACVRQHAPVLAFARDAVTRVASDPEWCERLRATPEAAAIFVELICTVPETRTMRGSIVGELHDVGLLLAMVPEFLPVTGRVHHDVYHVYTVDVHSVAAVDRLRQLARGELAHEMPLGSRLAVEIARPAPLFLATLLHDVGKGWPDASGSLRQHSKVGADMCEKILPRLGLAPEDSDEACQLVLDHLLMYRVATRRDLDDVATIAEFCRSVRGREGLRNLYLLTVSDLSTTSPTAMTSWKARMLDELYFAAEAHLAGQEPRADAERVARVRDAVRAAWSSSPAALEALLTSMPERYMLANGPESIIQHARVVLERNGRAAHVARVHSRHPEAAELCVVADDRPGLLASIAAALTANRLEVLAAQVYSRPMAGRVEAVDVFWVRDRDGGTEGVAVAMARLARDLEDVCSGQVEPAELLKLRMGSGSPWRERPSPAVPTEILLDDRASPRHTIVEVFAKDRPGLLYRLARALHGLALSIALSKINTEGTRVADVFYVSELDGHKVARGPRYSEIHDALVAAVDGWNPFPRASGVKGCAPMKTLRGDTQASRLVLWLACLVPCTACGGSAPPPETPNDIASSASPTAAAAPSAPEPAPSTDLVAGIKAFDAGDYATARTSFEAAAKKNPRNYEALLNLGLACEKLSDKAAAEAAYKSALAVKPDLENGAANLSALYVDEGRFDDALAVAKAGLAKHPGSAALHENMGAALAARGDQDEALKELGQAVQITPSDPMFHLTIAHWLNAWHVRGAAPHLDTALGFAKDDYAMIASIGYEYRMAGEFASCVKTFDRAVTIKDGGEVRTERALCRHGLKDDKAALDDLEAAVSVEPSYAPAHFYLGGRLAQTEHYKQAAAEYAKYLELEPNGSLAKPAADRMKMARDAAAKERGGKKK